MQNKFGLETHPNPIYMRPVFADDSPRYKAEASANATDVAQWWLQQHPELLESEDGIKILVKSIADDLEWPRSDVYEVLNSIPGVEIFDPFAEYKRTLVAQQMASRAFRPIDERFIETGPFDYLDRRNF